MEEPKFSTPDGNVKEAETTKEAARPPKIGRPGMEGFPKEAETTLKVPKPNRSSEDAEPTTVKVMLKLMEGMQALQRQMLEGRDEDAGTESVRQATALPALAEWSATTGPIDLIEPMLSDLGNSSGIWWQQLIKESHLWYQRHLQLPPLYQVAHLLVSSSELTKPK